MEFKRYADKDKMWQCQACGKTSETDKYGMEGRYSWGWDESCVLNAVEVPRVKFDDRV